MISLWPFQWPFPGSLKSTIFPGLHRALHMLCLLLLMLHVCEELHAWLAQPNLQKDLETLGLSQCHSKGWWRDLIPFPSTANSCCLFPRQSPGTALRHTECDLFFFLRKKLVRPSEGVLGEIGSPLSQRADSGMLAIVLDSTEWFPLFLFGDACFLLVFLETVCVETYFWRMVSRHLESPFFVHD